MTDKGSSGGYMVPYEGSLSGRLFDAIITIEDRRFIEHRGVDIRGKLAGIWDNIQAGQIVRGSSTLTEQYLKNAYYRGRDRTILQKIDEAIGAIWIEQTQSKDEILRGYLNHIYFGNRIYGIRAAVSTYFPQKSIATLTDDDILDLITRIHSPNISAANIDRVKTYRTSIANKLGWTEGESHLTDDIRW
jgi:membrane peptidoglycan carboxypeptidase